MKRCIYRYFAIGAFLCTFFTACRESRPQVSTVDGDTLALRYAEHLTMIEYKEYTEIQIHNPWDKGRLLQTLRINKHKNENREQASKTESPARLSPPFSRAILFTTTHSNLLEELGCIDAIAGICETEYIANPQLRQALAEGRIRDMGSAMTPDRERIVSLVPDIILLSPYENASTYGNLEGAGIPIIQCADYMETSALGRAEWIRFYGRLFGKGDEADSLFLAIETEYNNLRTLTDSVTYRPTVLFDTRNGSAWYVPGGRSTMAQLTHDAGGRYIFSDNTKSGSVPLSFESVLSRGEEADTWIIRYNRSHSRMSLTELSKAYQPYTLFKAYRQENVYGCNSAELIFYEETPFHPERLLRDFIQIFHPELLSNDTLRYFHKM